MVRLVCEGMHFKIGGNSVGFPRPWMLGVTENGQAKQLGKGQNWIDAEPWYLRADNPARLRTENNGARFLLRGTS